MSIQFAGSKSLDDRRRRRLVVNRDETGAANAAPGEGPLAGQVVSELVMSSAAAPWVPVYEWRVWTYAALMAICVSAAAFALARPRAFRPELAPLTRHLLEGDRPVLAVLIQTTFCFFAAQLSVLIGWYRAQGKLDFRGRYRVWPWAAFLFAAAAVCSATNLHGLVGQILEQTGLLPWRAAVVGWLLPAVAAGLPLAILLDRDVRRGRSSLYTMRVGWMLAAVVAGLELFAADLAAFPGLGAVRTILPMFVAATVFVGLWLHARVVAYICPDPPEPGGTSIVDILVAARAWLAGWFRWRRVSAVNVDNADTESKPKKGRRKSTEVDEAAPKRKRRTPARRTTKPRTRVKPAELEDEAEEELESLSPDESVDESTTDETESDLSGAGSSDWDDEDQDSTPPVSSRFERDSAAQPSRSSWQQAPSASRADDEDEDDDDDETLMRRDSGAAGDQLKGLSKRQKRELRRQAREQQRGRR